VTLQGDRGTLVLNGHDELRFFPKPTEAMGAVESESVACDVGVHPTPEANILHDFFTYVVEDIEPGISGRRNLRAVALCEGLVRSAKTKKPVELEEIK
jgi:predicted dehydrogenase